MSRRKFVAGAGAASAVAVVGTSKKARAATGDPIYRIHPAIGIARVGNADAASYFIGPEAPGFGPLGEAPGTAVPNYKDAQGRIKPQAARFRLFEYASVNGRLMPTAEVTLDSPNVVSIRWTVHLANKKASFHGFEGGQGEDRAPAAPRNASVTDRRSLEIDFGPRSIAGKTQAAVAFTPGTSANPGAESCPKGANGQAIIDYLGELRTDSKGRLVALGGKGRSGYNTASPPPMPHWANNDGWFDDASDGPVTAVVTLADGRQIAVDPSGGAWLLVAPPDFAPGVPGSVSAYDLLLDLAVRELPVPPENGLYDDGGPLASVRVLKAAYQPDTANVFPTYAPSFTEEIRPMLLAAYHLWWVDALVTSKHNVLLDASLGDPSPASASKRQRVLSYMRAPVGIPQGTGSGTMPKLLGDDPYIGQMPDAVKKLPLTATQYGLLGRWAAGEFTAGAAPPSTPTITAHGLDRAALENAAGGAFFPGIEFGWQMRNPTLFKEPFRLNLAATSGYWGETNVPIGPGHFSRQMAVPWQADFNDCRNEGNYGWWPSQRPTDALPTASARQRLPWARATSRFSKGNRESTHEDMVENWYKFGFVLEDGDVFIEKERAAKIP